MTTIRLTNTRTRRKEEFRPIDPRNVRLYVCGPTVYDRAHLGNGRAVVVFDVLFRLLRHVYGADHVTYARNFTDVDDKINARAAETGRPIRAITDETIGWFHEDMDALGALRPTFEPRATEWIGAMVAMIEGLVARGHAYEAQGHVLFRVRSYAGYGALSGRSVDDMMAGARVEVAPFKEDPLDFVLWKPSTEDQPGWDSPWGRGRPGWHIECSAMARERLGTHFDIHGGGRDLEFPHHENEIAQSACADPGAGFANVWMHNEMLLVDGKKMSKSLGNFFTVRDLLDQGVPGEVIRFVLLGTHYGKPMDWTDKRRHSAQVELEQWKPQMRDALVEPVPDSVMRALEDDLNTSLAITELRTFAKSHEWGKLKAGLELLGFNLDSLEVRSRSSDISGDAEKLVELAFMRRVEARKRQDWLVSDAIRAALRIGGVGVEDGENPRWFQSADDELWGWRTLAAMVRDQVINLDKLRFDEMAHNRGVDFDIQNNKVVSVDLTGRINPMSNLDYLRLACWVDRA